MSSSVIVQGLRLSVLVTSSYFAKFVSCPDTKAELGVVTAHISRLAIEASCNSMPK